MTMNTSPAFPLTPSIQWGATDGNGGAAGGLKTANTAKDGTGTVLTVFDTTAASNTNPSRVDYLKVRALGTNVATVLRVFINNGSTNATVANNVLFMERTIAATTLSEVAELADTVIPLDLSLQAGFKINVAISTSVSAGLMVTGVGAHY